MATKKQIAANRRNAQKSTGPRTEEGKAAASKNALKHGLSTPYGLLPGEDPEEYAAHREELLDELYPDSSIEDCLADRIVSLSWSLKRAGHFTRTALHDMLAGTCDDPFNTDAHPDVHLGRTIVRDFANARVIERLELYERRIESSLFKTMREYERLKKQSRPARENPQSAPQCHAERSDASTEQPRPQFEPATPDAENLLRQTSIPHHPESLSHAERSDASTEQPRPQQDTPTPQDPETSFFAKRTQFQHPKTEPNPLTNKDLQQPPPGRPAREPTQFHPHPDPHDKSVSGEKCA